MKSKVLLSLLALVVTATATADNRTAKEAVDDLDCSILLDQERAHNNECNTQLMAAEYNCGGSVANCDDKLSQEREYSQKCLQDLIRAKNNHTECKETHSDLLEDWQTQLQQCHGKLGDATANLVIYKDHLENCNRKKTDCTDQDEALAVLEKEKAECVEDLMQAYNNHTDCQQAHATGDCQGKLKDLEAYKKHLANCNRKKTECTDHAESLQALLDQAESKCPTRDQLSKAQQDHSHCKMQHKQALTDGRDWKQKYNQQVKEKVETQRQLDRCEKNVFKLEPALDITQEDVLSCQQELQAYQSQCQDDLTTELEKHQGVQKDLEDTKAAHQETQQDLQSLQEDHGQCLQDLTTAQEEQEKTAAQLATELEKHQGVQKDLEDTKAAHQETQQDLQSLQEDHDQCLQDLITAQQEQDKTAAQLAIAQPAYEECQATLAEAQASCLSESQQATAECHTSLSQAHQENAACHDHLSHLQTDHSQCQADYRASKDQVETLQQKLEDHKKANKKANKELKEQIQQLKKDLKDAQQETKLAESSLERFKEDCTNYADKSMAEQQQAQEEESGMNAQLEAEWEEMKKAHQEELDAAIQRAEEAEEKVKECKAKLKENEQVDEAEEAALRKEEEAALLAFDDAGARAEQAEQQVEECKASAELAAEQCADDMVANQQALNETKTMLQDLQEKASQAETKLDACMTLLASDPEPTPAARSCNLAMFTSVKFPDKGIVHQKHHGKIKIIANDPNPRAFQYYIRDCDKDVVDSCGNNTCVNLESHDAPGYFLRQLAQGQNYKIELVQWEENKLYMQDISFCLIPSLLSGGDDINTNEVSFESANYANRYITSQNDVDLQLLHVDDTEDAKSMASFDMEYLPCDSRRQLLRGDSSGGGTVS